MTFFFFIINAHIEIYFNIGIASLNVVHYKTLNTRLDILLLVINPLKPTWGPKCTFRSHLRQATQLTILLKNDPLLCQYVQDQLEAWFTRFDFRLPLSITTLLVLRMYSKSFVVRERFMMTNGGQRRYH
jgi:hypothetical protein